MNDAARVKHCLNAVALMFIERQDELSELDRKVGDGDHGVSMARGAEAAKEALAQLPDDHTINDAFLVYGHALLDHIGGAMGPLFGSILLAFAQATLHTQTLTVTSLKRGFTLALEDVVDLGNAQVGDKTMVDALDPAAHAASNVADDASVLTLLKACEQAAHQGMLSTTDMIAKRGRSKYRKEGSIGFQDAGATSFYYFVKTMHDAYEEVQHEEVS